MNHKDHKLAAIVFTDIVGYTKQMEENEQRTMELLQKQREIVFPIVESYNGEIIKEIGDGLMMMFGSAVEAVRCATSIQSRLKDEELTIRAGIHIGDVIFKDRDVFGSAVNTAARIEPLAPPNGICISETVRKQLENKDDIITISLGKKELKGVSAPLEIFQIFIEGVTTKQKQNIGFIFKDLWRRYVIQILFGYLIAAWIIKQAVATITAKYVLSPHLVDLSWIILISLIPAIFLLAYFHGKRSSGKWTRIEAIGLPINFFISIILVLVLFKEKDLGAATKTMIVEDEEGKKIETKIYKSEFRRKTLIFFYDNQSGDTSLNWLQYGIPILMDYDISQNKFTQAQHALAYMYKFRDADYENGIGAPFMLKKNISEHYNLDHFITGTFNFIDNKYSLATQLYETESGKLLTEFTIEDENLFTIVDQISINLFKTLKIPSDQLDEIKDFPVSKIFTTSLKATEYFVKGKMEIQLNGDYDNAIKYAELAVQEDKTFPSALISLAEYYFNNNMPEQAMDAVDEAMKNIYILPERQQFIIKFFYYILKQEPDKALAVVKMWTELFPEDIEAHETLAQRYQFKNMFQESIEEYRQIIYIDPDQTKYIRYIAELHEKSGNYDSALYYHQLYTQIEPQDFQAYKNMGDLYFLEANFEKAIENYDKAMLLEPGDPSVAMGRINIDLRMGRFDQAYEQYMELLESCSTPNDSSRVYSALSDFNEIIGQPKKSLFFFKESMKSLEIIVTPLNHTVYQLFSIHKFINADKRQEAYNLLKTSEEKFQPPVDKVVAFGYIFYFLALDNPDEAAQHINDAKELAVGFGEEMLLSNIYFAEGRIHTMKKDYDSAIISFNQFLESSPGSTGTYRRLAECYRNMGELEDAEEAILIALKHKPYYPKINYEAALIYFEEADEEKAREHLQRALEAWKDADADYEPMILAKEKLEEIGIS